MAAKKAEKGDRSEGRVGENPVKRKERKEEKERKGREEEGKREKGERGKRDERKRRERKREGAERARLVCVCVYRCQLVILPAGRFMTMTRTSLEQDTCFYIMLPYSRSILIIDHYNFSHFFMTIVISFSYLSII